MNERCFYCNANLIWQSDWQYSDIYDTDDDSDRIVRLFFCPKCGIDYEVSYPSECDTTQSDEQCSVGN